MKLSMKQLVFTTGLLATVSAAPLSELLIARDDPICFAPENKALQYDQCVKLCDSFKKNPSSSEGFPLAPWQSYVYGSDGCKLTIINHGCSQDSPTVSKTWEYLGEHCTTLLSTCAKKGLDGVNYLPDDLLTVTMGYKNVPTIVDNCPLE